MINLNTRISLAKPDCRGQTRTKSTENRHRKIIFPRSLWMVGIGSTLAVRAVYTVTQMNVLSSKVVRFVLAPALSFWIAGGGCILGCESMVAAAATVKTNSGHHLKSSSTIVASGHACSSQKSHNCCQSDEASPQKSQNKSAHEALVTSGGSSSGPMTCPFAVSRAAVVAKAQERDAKASAVLPVSTPAQQNCLEQTVPLSPPLRLPNRGHTYLRCCVFLI